MKYRTASLGAILLVASSADAYVYNVGPNYVDLPGSTCRATSTGGENNLYHDVGWTQVKQPVALAYVNCPISRRGTSFYGGKRTDGSSPPAPADGSQLKVNVGGVVLRGTDASSTYTFSCYVFGANKNDSSVHFGATKALCSSSLGCTFAGVPSSWTGENTMALAAPAGLSGLESVNFGINCMVPEGSTIYHTASSVTPN